jgi:hypothetical protein
MKLEYPPLEGAGGGGKNKHSALAYFKIATVATKKWLPRKSRAPFY